MLSQARGQAVDALPSPCARRLRNAQVDAGVATQAPEYACKEPECGIDQNRDLRCGDSALRALLLELATHGS